MVSQGELNVATTGFSRKIGWQHPDPKIDSPTTNANVYKKNHSIEKLNKQKRHSFESIMQNHT